MLTSAGTWGRERSLRTADHERSGLTEPVNCNSRHARGGGAQRLRRRPRSRDLGMAAFADLDLRAGSDLKALRGLVENAAHRESPGLRGPSCLRCLAVPRLSSHPLEGPGGPSSGVLGPLACPWKLKPLRCCFDPRRGKLESVGDMLPGPAPLSCELRKLRPWHGGGFAWAPQLMDSRKQDSQVYTYTDENISPLPASLDIVLILSNAGNWCRDGEYCGGPENGRGTCGSECWNVIYTESKWGRRTY